MIFTSYGQSELTNTDTTFSDNANYVDDYISVNGNKYTVALSDGGLLYMISKKDLDYEIGAIAERIEDFQENIHTNATIYASFWDVGAKVFKIKQIEAENYIAVEWKDAYSDNKYYIYCHKKSEKAKKTLKKYNDALHSER
jgi:hypothetical protein